MSRISKTLKETNVFRFKNEPMLYFICRIKPSTRLPGEKMFKIIREDGTIDWLDECEMVDVDDTTVRKYNPDTDIDFYGLDM